MQTLGGANGLPDFLRIDPGLWFFGSIATHADCEFDEAINHDAEPGIDQQTPVEAIRLVTRRRRQMRHEDEKVQQASEHDGGELLEDSAWHDNRLRTRVKRAGPNAILPYRKRSRPHDS